jgi:galacturan 1,4-alpha-galacturonidase
MVLLRSYVTADGTCISNPCWNFVQGGDTTQGIIFDLFPDTGKINLSTSTCSETAFLALNLTFTDINIHPFNKTANDTTVICDPSTLAPGEQDTLGFNCTRGPFQATEVKAGNSTGTNSAVGGKGVSSSLLAVFVLSIILIF